MTKQNEQTTLDALLMDALNEYGERKAKGLDTQAVAYRVFDVATVIAADYAAMRARLEQAEGRANIAEAFLRFATNNADKFTEHDPDGVKRQWIEQVLVTVFARPEVER